VRRAVANLRCFGSLAAQKLWRNSVLTARNSKVGAVAHAAQNLSQVRNSAVFVARNSRSSAVQKSCEVAIVWLFARSWSVAAKFNAAAVRNGKVGVVAHTAQSLSQVCNSAIVTARKSKALQHKICVAIVRFWQGSN